MISTKDCKQPSAREIEMKENISFGYVNTLGMNKI
jgi:hypothetical protein